MTPQKILTPLHHEIAPRPLSITDLYKDKMTTDPKTLLDRQHYLLLHRLL